MMVLNDTVGVYTNNVDGYITSLTSSTFGFAGSNAAVNTNGTKYIAYCWTPISGYSSFGTYTGNASSDGPFVYCGFKPRFIMTKGNNSSNWEIYDTTRNPYNESNIYFAASTSAAETTTATIGFDLLSNGFKVRGSGSDINGSGVAFYYMAFAEIPFKYARAR